MGQKLGRYIKNLRKDAKISVLAMSKKTGISKSYLDYIESGAREPQIDMLAKIAAVLETPLEAMIDIQKKEQLASAIIKLSVDESNVDDVELRAVARTKDGNLAIDSLALAKAQAAFRAAPDDKQLADFVENPDLKAIMKAGATLSDEDLDKLRKVMESLYPNAFEK